MFECWQQSELRRVKLLGASQPSSAQGHMRVCNILLFLTFPDPKEAHFPTRLGDRSQRTSQGSADLPKAGSESCPGAEGSGVTSPEPGWTSARVLFSVKTNAAPVPPQLQHGHPWARLGQGWSSAGSARSHLRGHSLLKCNCTVNWMR